MTGHVHSYSFYMRLCSLLHLIVDDNSSAVKLVVLISQKIAMKRGWCGTCNIGPIVLQATIPKHCKRALWYCCYDNETTTEVLWLHNLPCCKRLTISFCHIRLPIKHTWITRETLRRRFVARNWFVIWLICYLSIFAMLYYSYILRPSYYEDNPPPLWYWPHIPVLSNTHNVEDDVEFVIICCFTPISELSNTSTCKKSKWFRHDIARISKS